MDPARILDASGEPYDDDDASPERFTITLEDGEAAHEAAKDPSNPVQNDGPLPLFPGSDKRSTNYVTHIRVIKTDEPNSGYCGDAPNTADISWIGKRYGDGTFDFEACNEKGKVLRERKGVGIRMRTGPGMARTSADPLAVMDRTADLHTKAATQAREESRNYTEMVRTTLNDARERDRDAAVADNERITKFFTLIMQQGADAADRRTREDDARHERSLVSQRESHNQQMLGMGQLHAMTMGVMGKAIDMAGAADADEPYVRAITESVKGIDKIAELAQNVHDRKSGSNGNSNGKTKTNGKDGKKKGPTITQSEAQGMARLKRLCDDRGIDMEKIVGNANKTISGMTDEEIEMFKRGKWEPQAADDDNNTNDEGREQSSPEDDGNDDDSKSTGNVDVKTD